MAKLGAGFEQRVLKERNNGKFSVRSPGTPPRPHDVQKVAVFSGGGPAAEANGPEAPETIVEARKKEAARKKKKKQKKKQKKEEEMTMRAAGGVRRRM